jgi:hypothetical protein
MPLTADDLDGHSLTRRYEDDTFVRIGIRRTESEAYPSGWRYALHYGATAPDAVDAPTLDDGTIRRYDNSHEDTKGANSTSLPTPSRKRSSFREWSVCTSDSGAMSRSAVLVREGPNQAR